MNDYLAQSKKRVENKRNVLYSLFKYFYLYANCRNIFLCKEWYLNFISQQLATLEIKAYTDFI
ncbi:hypothetical protein EKS24_09505 [Streptococcus mutans]|nr:hypothetical protein [Streptococcus mutans]